MPWYLSWMRLGVSSVFTLYACTIARWVFDAEDRYRRSLTWKPAVATIIEHQLTASKLGASYVRYRFMVGNDVVVGDRFRSGSVQREEHLSNPALIGAGTELVIHYNPADPRESAIKIQKDRSTDAVLFHLFAVSLLIAYRAVRCETIVPNLFYRFLSANRRMADASGLKQQRQHSRQKSKYPSASQL